MTRKKRLTLLAVLAAVVLALAWGVRALAASRTFQIAGELVSRVDTSEPVVALTFALLLASSQVQKLLGVTGLHVVARVMGVLLAALAVQFLFDGIRESGIWR